MDFNNRILALLFTWGDTPVYLTESLLATWIVMGVLILFTAYVNLRMRKFKGVPTGFQNVVELLVDTMHGFAKETLGEELEPLGAYFFGVFAFVLASNYSALFGLRPPTSDLATTGALAIGTFILCHFFGIRKKKGQYFKAYLEPMVPFLPLNIIDIFTKPVSLAFRLYGNILSGIIIVGLLYNMLPIVCRFLLPNVAHAFFDIIVGAIQTYIFTILSMTFIREIASKEE
ncbi:MAG: F0F1 ATP synthase subunit A [Clostridiales bacterium]|nr:F0F1 ATP synthase subunit A [Clostridiales bacterium]